MTREEAIRCLNVHSSTNGSGLCTDKQHYKAKQLAIKALEQETNIKALGEELRMCQKSITDDKVLVGFNIAVAIFNKHFTGSEVQE